MVDTRGEICKTCGGCGGNLRKVEKCEACNGTGIELWKKDTKPIATGIAGDSIPKPKSAYELLMAYKRLHPDISVWFTGNTCPHCGKDIYTNGKTLWCSPDCRAPGTYAGLQEDYIR